MRIYVYSDESGTFDKVHNDYFVFAGIIIIGDNEKINNLREINNLNINYFP